MSKILITGALGAVGTPLWNLLKSRGHEVHGIDLRHSHLTNYDRCDISEYRQIEELFAAHKFDYVYHMAAEFGRVNGETYYEQLWKTNVMGTKHMLHLQERLKFRMIVFSSSEVYGDYPESMTEDVMDLHEIKQMNDYAITKWVNEMQVLNSTARFGTETVRVRLFNTYGPGEHYSPFRSVICLFTYRALHNLPYTVYMGHTRTSTYIDDCVRALANICERFVPGEVYNIAAETYHDIKILSDIVLKHTGRSESLVSYVHEETHNTLHKKTNNKKVREHLGFETTVDLEEGIRRTIEWQKQVYGVK